MKNRKEFPFESSRRLTKEEVKAAHKAISEKLSVKRKPRGRPPKLEEKSRPVSIRLHPKVLAWAKKEAKRRGVGYQTVINETLMKKAA